MTDIILIIILSVSIRVANDFYSPKHFLITYINGQTEEVMIGKGMGDYFCPSYCNGYWYYNWSNISIPSSKCKRSKNPDKKNSYKCRTLY